MYHNFVKESDTVGSFTYRTKKNYGNYQSNVAGGLLLIRYECVGYDDVRLALREQQTVMHSHQGHNLGIARCNSSVMVLEGEGDWTPNRRQAKLPHISVPHTCTDDEVAMLWFPGPERAWDFSNHSHKNRFRQMDFPTPRATDMYFIPMLVPLQHRELDTFMFTEMLNVKRYPQENVKDFEDDLPKKMRAFNPNCIPVVASVLITGKETFRRGSRGQMFRQGSKLYVHRFRSLQEVADMWQAGIIQQTRQDWGLTGSFSVSAFSLGDFRD